MAKDNDRKSEEHPENPADFSRIADAFKDMPIQQLMANPAAAFAAATAFGFGMATQMTDVFLRSMQAAGKASERAAKEGDGGEAAVQPVAEPVKEPAKARAEKPKPAKVTKPKATKPAAAKSPAPAKSKAQAAKAATAREDAPKPAKTVATKPTAKAKPAAKSAAKPKSVAGAKQGTAAADDLKQISGIGPKLEQMLNAQGITRFAEIAGLTKARIDKLDDTLGLSGRIGRDDWVGQAKSLSGDKS